MRSSYRTKFGVIVGHSSVYTVYEWQKNARYINSFQNIAFLLHSMNSIKKCLLYVQDISGEMCHT